MTDSPMTKPPYTFTEQELALLEQLVISGKPMRYATFYRLHGLALSKEKLVEIDWKADIATLTDAGRQYYEAHK